MLRPSEIHAQAGLILERLNALALEPRFVYFILDGTAVKIGVADDPQTRVETLQTANPRLLHLAAAIPGAGYAAEMILHEAFSDFRIRGEWFRLEAPGLEALIQYHEGLPTVFEDSDCCDAAVIRGRCWLCKERV